MHFEIENIDNQISGCKVIRYDFFSDKRGRLWSTFTSELSSKFGLDADLSFDHDKFSISKYGVLRGFHGDLSTWKLVTCLNGKIQQAVFDYRVDSPTYKNSKTWLIKDSEPFSVLIPPGVLNAFGVLSNKATYHYKLAYLGKYKDHDEQITVKWNDPAIKIEWLIENPILSNRDS